MIKQYKVILLFSLLFSCGHMNDLVQNKSHNHVGRNPSTNTFSSDDAYEVYNQLRRMQFTLEDTQILVQNADPEVNQGAVSYGGEKEGSSARITKVFGPSGKHFKTFIAFLDEENKEKFLKAFIKLLQTKKLKQVEKLDGSVVTMSYKDLKKIDISSLNVDELSKLANEWIDKTEGSPFSFLSLAQRKALFRGDFAGMTEVNTKDFRSYKDWVPNFGMAEKFLDSLVDQNTITGWEIITKPQYSYGEHEQMISWFKKTMGTSNQEFQAPGHQRMLWPRPQLDVEAEQVFNQKLAGTYRLAQALIVLQGIAGNTGINFGHWKFMLSDNDMRHLRISGNSIFRLEKDRFVEGARSIEMRAGTKDKSIQRFIQQIITARVASGDFSGIARLDEWELIPSRMTVGGFPGRYDFTRFVPSTESVAKEYGMKEEDVSKAFENIKSIKRMSNDLEIPIRYEFWIPFWNWDGAPFLSDNKKKLLKTLTKSFLESVAMLKNPNADQIQKLFQDWARVSELDVDIKRALVPKKDILSDDIDSHKFNSPRQQRVDVNRIPVGIEYSASFPLDNKMISTDELEDGKKHWSMTTFDLSEKERDQALREYATNLAKELGVENPSVKKIQEDGHGHGLDVAYAIKDNDNREWRVEWDGIGRSYTRGKKAAMKTSKRGGHIEIVTPKFIPKEEELDAVYRAMEKSSVNPAYRKGGSHINIDLSPFEGKPKELARFIAIFHQYRSIISLMYQHPNRRNAAEAIDISQELVSKLSSFNGSEDELKRLLYDERYFNTRLGRKTRYNQLDMSAFFQDVIPDEFISADFDISNPWIPWRRQFRVNPKVRKMEFRLFGAPDSSYEGALQLKLVRAMLDKALNDDSPISPRLQNTTHEEYLKNPKKAYRDLGEMLTDLGLDKSEYEVHVSRGLEYTDAFVESDYYRSVEQKNIKNKKMSGWKVARENPRSVEQTDELRDRVINIPEEDLEASVREHMYARQRSASASMDMRDTIKASQIQRAGLIIRKPFQRLPSCNMAIKEIMNR